MTPYFNTNFFEFFVVMFTRIPDWFLGKFVHDEIQMFSLILLSICGSLLGSFIIYRKMSMMINSLSHTILLGIIVAFLVAKFLFGAQFVLDLPVYQLMLGALIASFLTYYLTSFLHHQMDVQEDASMGLVFTLFFAVGIILVTLFTRNAHIGVDVIMGNIDAIHQDDLSHIFLVTFIIALLISLFYKELFLSTFDPSLAKIFGFSLSRLNFLMITLSSLVVIVGFRAVGLIVMINILIAPVMIAKIWVKNWTKMCFISALIGISNSMISVAATRHMLTVYEIPLSTSGMMSFLYFITFILIFFIHKKGVAACKKEELRFLDQQDQ
jgi:manganese/zinc/iron transport system permease protein